MQTSIATTSGGLGPHKSPLDWLPGLKILRDYDIHWLRNDIVAGIVLSTMLVPVGVAYAVASGLPAINGLYATIIPLVAYAICG
ncbi:MAG: SulP family inorganic anion transporter, partial [Sphingomonas sp.]